ncbi:MAG: hypothetical protein HQL52_14720 [Magnetococcales bacterium]|nr:hypothetical protein [Magnetococcales bacterium]
MRVRFGTDVLQDPAAERYLDWIMTRLDRGVHIWEIPDPDQMEASGWYQRVAREGNYIQLLMEKSAEMGAYPANRQIHSRCIVVGENGAPGREEENATFLPAEPAACYLDKPLSILVENKFSDGKFLKIILKAYGGDDFNEWYEQVDDQGLTYISGGGVTDLPNHIDDQMAKASEDGIPLRLVVLTDRDSDKPGGLSNQVGKVVACCKEHQIVYHVLIKRAIENYIPDETLEAWALQPSNHQSREKVETVLDMEPGERDFVDMKSAIERKIFKKIMEQPADLWTKDNLVLRDGAEELDQLVELILKEV